MDPAKQGALSNVRVTLILVLLIAASVPARALTDEEVFRDFQFNLINPGARSLALGGAFISLADDATAAQANPAGLGFHLRKPEYFLELRSAEDQVSSLILREELPAADAAVSTGTGQDAIQSVSFLSYVKPFRTGKERRWTLGLSRQEVLNTDNEIINNFVFSFPGSPGIFLVEGSGGIEVRQTNFNVSAGFRLNDRLAVGGSVALAHLSVDSQVENFIVDTTGTLAGMEILEPTLDLRTRTDDSDSALAFSAGVIWSLTDRINLGAVYRRAPKFELRGEVDEEGLDTFNVRDPANIGTEFVNEFNMPDSYGVGVSWRPNDELTLALDVERIEYSDLVEGFVPGVNALTGFDAEFTTDDATEVRIGGEYVLLFPGAARTKVVALRAGAYTASDNTIRASSTGTGSFASEDSFAGGDDEVHGTAGIGLSFIGKRNYTVDMAVDLGEEHNQYLVSFIFRGK